MKHKIKVTEDNGTLYTMKEWIDLVKNGVLFDSSGFGSYSDGVYVYTHTEIYPSDIRKNLLDITWSHVMWYNR